MGVGIQNRLIRVSPSWIEVEENLLPFPDVDGKPNPVKE
jgi:hypothetical protein